MTDMLIGWAILIVSAATLGGGATLAVASLRDRPR
jgi:hypothetical protein